MSAAAQASPLNRLAANLEELGLEGMASSVPEYVRLVADGRKSLVDAMLELTDAQIALKRRADLNVAVCSRYHAWLQLVSRGKRLAKVNKMQRPVGAGGGTRT